MTMSDPTPVLFILPQGLTVTGVTTWGVRLAAALADTGRRAGLIVHGSLPGHAPIELPIPAGVRVYRFDHLPRIDTLAGDVTPIADAYEHAVADLGQGAPVTLVPTRHGDCFGACAELTRRAPGSVRVVGWQHGPLAYEDALLARYEPICAHLACVSEFLADRLSERFAHRAADITRVPNSVETPAWHRTREPLGSRPVRIIYTGRIEHEHKRIGALGAMSDALRAAGVAHELTLVGDGPGARTFDDFARTRPGVVRIAPVAPDSVTPMLDASDIAVLSSRTEGLSLSILEAMARGCVPVITATPSGSAELVEDGVSGVLVPCVEESDERLGERLAQGIARATDIGLETLSTNAWRRARDRFSPALAAERAGAVIDAAGAAEPRAWTGDESPAFSAAEGAAASGSVPRAAAELLGVTLASLMGRRVAIHGTGAHTRHLRPVIERSSNIVAFLDDDPTRAGSDLWGVPVVEPKSAPGLGVTDVVISSWMHEDAIWARRGDLEAAGVRVHRLYTREHASAA